MGCNNSKNTSTSEQPAAEANKPAEQPAQNEPAAQQPEAATEPKEEHHNNHSEPPAAASQPAEATGGLIEKHETEDKIRDTPDVMDGNGHHDSASDTQTQGKDQTDENSQLADCGAATLANGLADNNELHSDKPTEEHNAGGIESSGDNSIAHAQHDSAGLSDDSKTEDCGQEHKHLSQSVEEEAPASSEQPEGTDAPAAAEGESKAEEPAAAAGEAAPDEEAAAAE